ncbi:hypothetical protein KDA_77090 [Dictyobacter alpinus]|uniref:Uncharacterized protein n=1 Tax=Dictyobacter alpinus TaxID=2014873 RepID=A0A402BLH3_9CHLR|nr:hypothetical protein KDA_77090 [Dictyobacter alpinus]
MADKKGKDEKKDEGMSEYIDKVILNPNLEKELKETGSPYKIPHTPPIQSDKDNKKK